MSPGVKTHMILAGAVALAIANTDSRGAQQTATWLGGNGSWLVPTKWSGGVVPNNGADTFDVVIEGDQSASSNVNLNVSPPAQYTVSSLRIASGDLLSIKPTIVNVSGPLTVDGDFWVIGGELVVGSSQTLGGNGTLWLDED